jgi:proteasome accessory factor C
MLPWLMERGEVPWPRSPALRPDAGRGGADLELAAMCGLPPFVDEMIDVFIDDDTVFVGVPRLFTRPLRLTAPEGFALVAAGRAAMQLPGAEPAAARAGPAEAGGRARRRRRRRRPAVTPALATAIETVTRRGRAGERLRIEYWTASRDEVTDRDDHAAAGVQRPRRVVRGGRRRPLGERRTFRIADGDDRDDGRDTIRSTDRCDRSRDWFADAWLGRVTLRLPPAAAGSSSATGRHGKERAAGSSTPRSRWRARGGSSGCWSAWGRTPRCERRRRGRALAAEVAGGCSSATPTPDNGE